jgi:hypothetical protein
MADRAYNVGSLSPSTKQDPPAEEPTVSDAKADTATVVDDAGE